MCPLESLPECVALYEFMGRTPDKELRERAKEITKSCNGGSASDAIKLTVRFSFNCVSSDSDHLSFGSVDFTFYYDAMVVRSLKMVPPSVRSYDPATKAWTVELLALPHALEFLGEIGYSAPTKELKALSDALVAFDDLINHEESSAETSQDLESSSNVKQEDDSDEQLATTVENTEKDIEKNNLLKEKAKEIVSMLQDNKKETGKPIDRSDFGQAKIRRLTSSQIAYSRRVNGYDDNDDYGFNRYDSDSDDEFDFMDMFNNFYPSTSMLSHNKQQRSVAQDCDCGQPWKTIGGRHTCRYFGKFDCYSCGNTWTSAYCWKGESQSCRQCNKENLPVMTEKLKSDPTLCRNTNGAHDSSRCAMCQKLGYSCTYSL